MVHFNGFKKFNAKGIWDFASEKLFRENKKISFRPMFFGRPHIENIMQNVSFPNTM